jgi:hypothetical protein
MGKQFRRRKISLHLRNVTSIPWLSFRTLLRSGVTLDLDTSETAATTFSHLMSTLHLFRHNATSDTIERLGPQSHLPGISDPSPEHGRFVHAWTGLISLYGTRTYLNLTTRSHVTLPRCQEPGEFLLLLHLFQILDKYSLHIRPAINAARRSAPRKRRGRNHVRLGAAILPLLRAHHPASKAVPKTIQIQEALFKTSSGNKLQPQSAM